MPSLPHLKRQLYLRIQSILEEKITIAKTAIASAKEARDSETKSSVGDKYETGRAMMQSEIAREEGQLQKALQMMAELKRVDMEKAYNTVELGCLVKTDRGTYFLSVGLGKLPGEDNHFAISMASPIAQLMVGKKVGNTIQLQNTVYQLLDIE